MWLVKKGFLMDPEKIKALTEWPQLTTVTEVKSFLGFVSYYRRFIPNFSKVAKPSTTGCYRTVKGTPSQKKRFKAVLGARTAGGLWDIVKALHWVPYTSFCRLQGSFCPPHWSQWRWTRCSTVPRPGWTKKGHSICSSKSCLRVRGIIQFTDWNSLHWSGP